MYGVREEFLMVWLVHNIEKSDAVKRNVLGKSAPGFGVNYLDLLINEMNQWHGTRPELTWNFPCWLLRGGLSVLRAVGVEVSGGISVCVLRA